MSTGYPVSKSGASAPTRGVARDALAQAVPVVLRIVAALLWIENLSWKRPPQFGQNDNAGLYFFTTEAVSHPVWAPYTSFVENVVLTNFTVFAWAAFLLEIGLGVFLLLGLATRLWALLGILQSVVIFLTVSATPGEWVWSYYLMATLHLALLGMAAGRVLGIDAVLRPRVTGSSLGARLYRLAS